MTLDPTLLGTNQNDTLETGKAADVIVGLAGDDTISSAGNQDTVYGDFVAENLLQNPDGATSLTDYAAGQWTLGEDASGASTMTQSVTTIEGARYEVSFEHAATYAAGTSAATVTLFWNDEEIGRVASTSASFADASFDFVGTGEPGDLTFRVEPLEDPDAPQIISDGPISYYTTTMDIGGQDVDVKAFAPGQAKIYQVMDGKLHVFDPESETYAPAGVDATVVVNSIGFNTEDDMIYGIAVSNGVDALGQAVSRNDLVMYDAEGHAYRIGETPYRSWTGDFDDQGRLWYFEADFDRITMVDVDAFDADGNPIATTFKFPKDMITDKVWDVAFDAESQSFYGLVRPSYEGGEAKLIQIDVSAVAGGGEPTFTTTPVTGTLVDGVLKGGVPLITFGAFMIDGDSNFYAGGNGGDHDMNDSTGTSGGIYRVIQNDDGTATLELVSDAPKAYSNDGAVDARAMDPFQPVDPSAIALIRGPELFEALDPEQSYDDVIQTGAGADVVLAGYGDDIVVGASSGDHLKGETGDDALYGGAGPGSTSTTISFYDDEGTRFDQFGNVLGEDDDLLEGGEGNDLLDGSAGHDTLDGGAGADTLSGGSGSDDLSGGSGDDALSGGGQDDVLHGEEGADTLEGGSGNDDLSGGSGVDSLKGGSGDDVLDGGTGDDRLDGGSGSDTVDGGDGADYIKGGSGNDQLSGGEGNDYLNASHGNDVIDGGDGKDRIYLGAGEDVATGGAGSDRFIFRKEDIDGTTDTITDFIRDDTQSDRLDFRGLNLLEAMAADAWLAAFVTKTDAGQVEIALGGETTLICEATTDVDDLFNDVCDGILF